ncbi:DUF4189 domain-containing protein [Mycobacterium sp. 852002-51163_SCH5372311]|uniref:DUF4189 domain-containing protein n=1 Tax=Mycobacterium sp. 852002-51163_SCH5372311 TaxID=1834097 RepID=UPI0009ECE74F|nr:DUF4189 domain-containing protein [Mycobacterium sp. 852002-51163_SCH5372311]
MKETSCVTRAAIFAAGAAAVAALTVTAAPTAYAAGDWGALAVSADGKTGGTASGANDETTAMNSAASNCQAKTNSKCTTVTSLHRGTEHACGALAVPANVQAPNGPHVAQMGYGGSVDAARQAALQQQPGGNIVAAACA